MKAALVVNRVLPDIDANLTAILDMVNEAADAGADIVVFPEAALTGLINSDEPSYDLPLGQPIPGPVTDILAGLAHERRIWLAIGLLERDGDKLYDSAVLLTPDGEIRLKHQRIQPQWHGKHADPSVYCQGTALSKVETPLGSFAFLICGELFDDELIQRVRDLRPDWLLFPFARCFDEDCQCEQRWNREEKTEYAKRVKLVGVTTLMTNYLSEVDGCFGGAMVVSGDGTVVDSFPLGKVGILMVDL
ncbi:carbon-nitrogen hydrolase family protein [Candidatus Poribacteria bacterium]|nr:carbon-nitrogen hydrolase family protein [Candidatus Poribacteria bacterium]